MTRRSIAVDVVDGFIQPSCPHLHDLQGSPMTARRIAEQAQLGGRWLVERQ